MRTKILLLCVLMLVLMAGVAWAQAPGTGLKATDHDFTQTAPEFKADVGLCTFCHTPHKAGTQRLIWNHELPNQSYTWGAITHTIGGTELPTIDTSWTGPTRFCLSCHDGSVAFGSVYWFDKAAHLGASKIAVSGGEDTMTQHPNHLIGFGGSLAGNHPVAVPYPYLKAQNTYNGKQTGQYVIMEEFFGDPTGNGIRLFNDTGTVVMAGAAAGKTGMECSSCHDPHNGSTVRDTYFLRGKLKGSDKTAGVDTYICLKCHDK